MKIRLFVIFMLMLSSSYVMRAQNYELPEVPSRITDSQERIDFLSSHFWKKFNVRKNTFDEQMMVDYLTVTSLASDVAARKGILNYYKKFKSSPEALSSAEGFIEKYLYDPESPLFNESLFEMFLETGKSPRSEYYHEQISSNKVGTYACDFSYRLKDGHPGQLSDNFGKSEMIILIFYDQECSNCQRMLSDYSSSLIIGLCSVTGRIITLAVDISSEKSIWMEEESSLPDYCQSVILDDEQFFDDAKYLFRSVPALYLLDGNGLVLMKDTTVKKIEDYIYDNL